MKTPVTEAKKKVDLIGDLFTKNTPTPTPKTLS